MTSIATATHTARLGVPLSTLHREVARLDEAGLIASRTLGRNRLLRANPSHPAAGAPPYDIDVFVVGKVDRADLYDAADPSDASSLRSKHPHPQ